MAMARAVLARRQIVVPQACKSPSVEDESTPLIFTHPQRGSKG